MHSENKKDAPLWSYGLLIIIIYLLQFGITRLNKWLALEGNLFKFFVLANQLFAILLPVVLFIIILRLPAKKALGLHAPPWKKAIIAVLLGFAATVGISWLLPRLIPPSQVYASRTGSIVAYSDFPGLLLTFVIIAVAAPLADEFLFRGLLLQGIMTRYGKIAAILITAALTALFHTLEPFKLLHAFIMGTIFATAVVWTRSVYTSIILHCFNNLLSLLPFGF